MLNPNNQAPDFRATTAYPFYPCNAEGNHLFQVRAGVSAVDALQEASNLLDAAKASAFEIATNRVEDVARNTWTLAYLLEMAKAVVDAAITNMEREARQ
ncbi:DUF3077 domain-containing protein [Candidatus Methylospira mobilis]|uniref:DUF3077 domain-containing protein n=1 Tax=Candidatus Methylospira mobilis TaxID=1808979 RepID=A0A5Q0BFK9_9GAMM|nr:DUF3077 domain-containing protein [Candidatus Methylospira mobilis]QFY42319.1 DUF3077 domain-containing protein [Candidatus Methylospira mobilis]